MPSKSSGKDNAIDLARLDGPVGQSEQPSVSVIIPAWGKYSVPRLTTLPKRLYLTRSSNLA